MRDPRRRCWTRCHLPRVYVWGWRFLFCFRVFCCSDAFLPPVPIFTPRMPYHSLIAHITMPGLLLKRIKKVISSFPHKTVPNLSVGKPNPLRIPRRRTEKTSRVYSFVIETLWVNLVIEFACDLRPIAQGIMSAISCSGALHSTGEDNLSLATGAGGRRSARIFVGIVEIEAFRKNCSARV